MSQNPKKSPQAALELRVVEGPQAGARMPLPLAGATVLAVTPDGLADGASVVLRDDASPAARVQIQAGLPLATLQVIDGSVQVGADTLQAGASADWTMHTPLRIGRVVVAFGAPGSQRWLVPAAGEAPGPEGAAADAASAVAQPAAGDPAAAGDATTPTPLSRRPEVWLATLGLAVLLACGGAIGLTQGAEAPKKPVVPDALAMAEALAASDFATLRLTAGSDGRPLLSGRLATQADRLKLESWLARGSFAPKVDVQIDETLALEVTEVFRVHGVAVKARVSAPGKVTVEASERDHARFNHAQEVVRRDVKGLVELTARNSALPAPPPRPVLADDPAKRITAIVTEQPPYLVTADGARYFIGALLPSGHRIVQIATASVTVERDGQASTLNF